MNLPFQGAEEIIFSGIKRVETREEIAQHVARVLVGDLLCFITNQELELENFNLLTINEISGRGQFGLHIDEPLTLLETPNRRVLNAHTVLGGSIGVFFGRARKNYYDPESDNVDKIRVPKRHIGKMLEEDLIRGKYTDGTAIDPSIYKDSLSKNETVVFAETIGTIDETLGTIHWFYGGTPDRYSVAKRYQEKC